MRKKHDSIAIVLWCGKQDLNLHEIAFTRT